MEYFYSANPHGKGGRPPVLAALRPLLALSEVEGLVLSLPKDPLFSGAPSLQSRLAEAINVQLPFFPVLLPRRFLILLDGKLRI